MRREIDGTYDVAIDKEFDQEQVTEIAKGLVSLITSPRIQSLRLRLVWVRERAENTGRTAIGNQGVVFCKGRFLECLNLRPIHPHQQQTSHKSPENLGDDVVRDLLPGEALPDGKTQCYGGVEMSSRS